MFNCDLHLFSMVSAEKDTLKQSFLRSQKDFLVKWIDIEENIMRDFRFSLSNKEVQALHITLLIYTNNAVNRDRFDFEGKDYLIEYKCDELIYRVTIKSSWK